MQRLGNFCLKLDEVLPNAMGLANLHAVSF